MIISPPFLPARNANETDEAYLNRAMPVAEHGRYPVSNALGWHGGVHLTAPAGTNNQVRAIADGTVAYVRTPTKRDAPEAGVLEYKGWTDNGCVVIRHDTAIGATDTTETLVQFYSIYMHLSEVRTANVVQGQRINRKTVLGTAGSFEDKTNLIHFEVICDDINLQQLIGRNSGDLNTSTDGRTDAVFGEIYFKLPAETQIYAERPALNEATGKNGTALNEELFVGIRYGVPHDATTAYGGDALISTYRADGTTLGDALREGDAEYNLYRDAGRIVTAFRTARAAIIPAHSAVYELLRFGRKLGPDELNPDDTPHWRKILTAAGECWVNLNTSNIKKYSDADAPHWAKWRILEDYQDGDSRCDLAVIRELLNTTAQNVATEAEVQASMAQESTLQFMQGVVAKFPTEWHRGNVDTHWKWLTTEGPSQQGAGPPSMGGNTYLTASLFQEFQNYAKALCFWEDANLGPPPEHWHFHPRKFIGHFRKCGWLSKDELQRILPGARNQNINRFSIPINLTIRKYLGDSPVRRSHFLGQAGHETEDLRGTMAEKGNSAASREYESDDAYFQGPDSYTYFQTSSGYERLRNTLGNEYSPNGTGDGLKFRGRGSLQITGRAHYSEYWVYRGWLDPNSFDANWWTITGWWTSPRNPRIIPAQINDPQRISARQDSNEYNPMDVGGSYWVRKSLNQACDPEDYFLLKAPRSNNVSMIINRYDTNTFPARKERAETAKGVLCDGT